MHAFFISIFLNAISDIAPGNRTHRTTTTADIMTLLIIENGFRGGTGCQ